MSDKNSIHSKQKKTEVKKNSQPTFRPSSTCNFFLYFCVLHVKPYKVNNIYFFCQDTDKLKCKCEYDILFVN